MPSVAPIASFGTEVTSAAYQVIFHALNKPNAVADQDLDSSHAWGPCFHWSQVVALSPQVSRLGSAPIMSRRLDRVPSKGGYKYSRLPRICTKYFSYASGLRRCQGMNHVIS